MLCKFGTMLRYMRSLEEVDPATIIDIVGDLASLPYRRGNGSTETPDGRLFELGVYQDVGDALDFLLSAFHDGYIDLHGSAGGGYLMTSSDDRDRMRDVIDDLFSMEIIEVKEGKEDNGTPHSAKEGFEKVFVFPVYLAKYLKRYHPDMNMRNGEVELTKLIQLSPSFEDGVYIPITVSFLPYDK
jgi:hypothetical protein